MRRRLAPWVLGLITLLVGACSGGQGNPEATSSSTTETTVGEPVLDLRPIAGYWHGPAEEENIGFWVDLEISPGAVKGDVAAIVEYRLQQAGRLHCIGEWWAESADPPVYEFVEVIVEGQDSCSHGRIQITHDAAAGILEYEFFGAIPAVGVLSRPGAP